MDILTREKRSALMSRVGAKDTRPEVAVRKVLHGLGYRFRLHRADLPGRPDIVLPRHRTTIFVHGCFWHRHPRCRKATTPKSNCEFWFAKFAANRRRDRASIGKLRRIGWQVIVIWECETKDPESIIDHLGKLLGSPDNP